MPYLMISFNDMLTNDIVILNNWALDKNGIQVSIFF